MANLSKTFGLSGEKHAQSLTGKQSEDCRVGFSPPIPTKRSGKLTIPLLVLLTISFSAAPAYAKYGGGTGGLNDPYLIFDANQMNEIGANPDDLDKNFILMADIDLADYTGTDFNIIGSYGNPFTGVFDGNGHTISNFSYTSIGTSHIALFAYVSGENAEIKNLGLLDPNVNSGTRDYAGSLVSQLSGATINNCYVQGGSVSGTKNIGGLVGNNDGTITNSYSTASVSGSVYVGGLVGSNGGTISNCYATGSASGGNVVGGLAGYNDGQFREGTITNCYSAASVSGGQYLGGLLGHNRQGEVNNSFWDIETSGQATSARGTGKTTAEMKTASTFITWACDYSWTIDEGQDYPRLLWQNAPGETIAALLLGSGSGTQADPYLISTSEHLNTIGLMPCLWDRHFKLMADIDLAGFTGTAFNIIGSYDNPFTGVFDGNGHTISNFSYTSVDTIYTGLFGYVDGPDAEIKNLGLIAPDVDGGTESWGVGSLVGYLKNGTINACYAVDGSVSGTMSDGELAGYSISESSLILDYTVNPIPPDLRNISTTGTVVWLNDDQVSGAISLPFNFNFYGTEYSQVFISSNGFITFLSGQPNGCCSGWPLPNTDPWNPHGLIAGFWTDLYPPGAQPGFGIRYQTRGAVGSREFIIGFYNVPHCCSANYYPVTFEIILHERTSNIELQYGLALSPAGYITSVGIENFDGTDGLQVAYGYDVSFYNEAFLIGVERNVGVGGLLGYNGGAVTNCYAEGGSASEGGAVGGLVGWNYGIIANCYSTGSASGEQFVGGLVGDNLGTVFSSFWDIETSGQPSSDGGTGLPTAEMQMATTFITWGCDSIWTIDDGNDYPRLAWQNMPGETITKPSYGGGTGTQADPYLIYTAEQLNMVGLFLCDLDKHFMLMVDIDLSSYTAGSFNIIGNKMTAFTGTFDGNDHTISNFSYTSTGKSYIGLFSYVDDPNAVIKNLVLLAPNVNGTADYAGSLVGYLANGTVSSCYVQAGSVEGNEYVGGLVGENDGTITNSYATGSVSGITEVGGLVGYNEGDIVTNCYSDGSVSGTTDVGGLVGYNYEGTITDCYATGEVTGSGMMIGGLVGYNESGTISDCQSDSSVSGMTYVGGLVGYNYEGTITYCYATGEVMGSEMMIGGLIGLNDGGGTVNNCYATGSVSQTGDFGIVGGLVGYNAIGTVTSSYATGSVSGYMYVGGLAGASGGTMSNCYADGDSISGYEYVGGLVGFNMEIIANSYSNYSVSGMAYVGGLVGLNDGPVIASFWDIDTSGQSSSDGGTGRTTTQMQTRITFTNAAWDFITPVWTIDEGVDYPRLWWEIVPLLHAEPEITLGASNIISWDPIPGASEYYAECAEDADFTTIAYSIGGITETSCQFTGLESGKRYWYRVKARNSAGVESYYWSNVESSLQVTLADAVDMMLDTKSLKNKNMKNALLNKINAVQKMIADGLYAEALDKLRNDILQKTDGCALTGQPDRNDWIKTCEAQSRIYPLIIEAIENVSGLMEQSPELLRTATRSSGDTRRVTLPLRR